ncbi:MAG: F0F1 ATP synthase subunit epsilon [Ornithinimicrobium sp.]
MATLEVSLVAADRMVWEGQASMIRVRGSEGDLGIMAGHIPVLGVLVGGDIRIDTEDGSSNTVTIDSGFISVDHDRVTIVADNVDASSLDSAST